MLEIKRCIWCTALLLMLTMMLIGYHSADLYLRRTSLHPYDQRFIPSPFLVLGENSTVLANSDQVGVTYPLENKSYAVNEEGKFGFVLASQYGDQLTGGASNLISMQCWASTVSPHLRVVEPFLTSGSHFGHNLTEGALINSTAGEFNLVKLSDVYDINSWERDTSRKTFASLTSMEFFLSHKPQNLILVHTNLATKFKELSRTFNTSAKRFARRYNLTIVRYVDYQPTVHSPSQFKKTIYGSNTVMDSVVLFFSWGGIEPHAEYFRINVSGLKQCGRDAAASGIVYRASKRIELDGQRYMEKYLSDKNYISVMLRLQMYTINHFKTTESNEVKIQKVLGCVDNIKKKVDQFKSEYGVKSVFLAMDSGKHGSDSFTGNFSRFKTISSEMVNNVSVALHRSLFGNSSSLQEWEESFDDISSFKTRGYVALLQKYLAYSGMCLLTAGGGSFQSSAMQLYKEKHISSSIQCGKAVPQC